MNKFSEALARAIADAHEGIGSLTDKVVAEGDWPANYQSCSDELTSNLEAQWQNMATEVRRLKAFASAVLQPPRD